MFGAIGSMLGLGSGGGATVFSGLTDLLGSGIGGMFGQSSANAQMEFQKEMRATSYQTAVDDMKKAGLNPMLAYSQGGAATPGGASAHITNPLSGTVNSAVAMEKLQTDIKKSQAEENLLDKKANLEGFNLEALAPHLAKEAEANAHTAEERRKQQEALTPLIQGEAKVGLEFFKRKDAGFWQSLGEVIKRISPFVNSASQLAK